MTTIISMAKHDIKGSKVLQFKALDQIPDDVFHRGGRAPHPDTLQIMNDILRCKKPVMWVRLSSPSYATLRASSIAYLRISGRIKYKRLAVRGNTIYIHIR